MFLWNLIATYWWVAVLMYLPPIPVVIVFCFYIGWLHGEDEIDVSWSCIVLSALFWPITVFFAAFLPAAYLADECLDTTDQPADTEDPHSYRLMDRKYWR